MSKMTITVHERKSEDFNYSRASTPVAKAYELLDDYFCDNSGALSKHAIDKIFLTFRNEKDLVDRCKSKATKSHSIAWDALLREIQATLEWDDEFPHATKLSSEQVKKWFSSKGRDFKEDLKPLVDAIDQQRKTWDEERASNKGESMQNESDVHELEFVDIDNVHNASDFDKLAYDAVLCCPSDLDVDTDSVEQGVLDNDLIIKARGFNAASFDAAIDRISQKLAGTGIVFKVDDVIKNEDTYAGTQESKKSESIVTDLTNAIQQNQPEVLLSDDAVTHFDDYDNMLDEFEGAYQTIIHVAGKDEVNEMMFLYVPEENIIAIGDFDVDRANADRAKELMEKFVRGELTKKPGSSDDLENVDYIAIVDGNTYTSTVFVEG